MLLRILILVQAAAAVSASPPPSPEAETQRAGEAYGRCIGEASQEHGRTSDDVDSIIARSLEDCAAEGAVARQTYIAYLRTIGIDATPEQVDQVFGAGLPQLRQRIAGCLAVARANREDGGRRMC